MSYNMRYTCIHEFLVRYFSVYNHQIFLCISQFAKIFVPTSFQCLSLAKFFACHLRKALVSCLKFLVILPVKNLGSAIVFAHQYEWRGIPSSLQIPWKNGTVISCNSSLWLIADGPSYCRASFLHQ